MKIEQQCATLEQSKRLKELGVSQSALHSYQVDAMMLSFDKGIHKATELQPTEEAVDHAAKWDNEANIFSAFSCAELMEALDMRMFFLQIAPPIFFNIGYSFHIHMDSVKAFQEMTTGPAMTSAEGMAALLIHLLENNHITASEVNDRLRD